MIGSLIGGLISKGGADAASGAAVAAGQAGFDAAQNAADEAWLRGEGAAWQARMAASRYTSAGYAATKEILNLLGLGTLNPMSEDRYSYGHTSLNQTDRAGQQDAAYNRFRVSPDYRFRVDEGIKARDRSAASRGMLLSGRQGKELDQWGQQSASDEYGNYFNRIAGIAGLGAGATTSTNATATGALTSANSAATGIRGTGINALTSGSLAGARYGMEGANALGRGISDGFNNLVGFGAYKKWI